MKNKYHSLKRLLSMTLVMCLITVTLSGCDIGSKHLEMKYEENSNDDIVGWDDVADSNVTDWDNGNITTWDDVDDYSDWVYAEILFDDISEEMPVVECRVLDYQTNGQYFDGEKVYSLVGDKFDVNSFVSKYAVGTGVIVICVVLNVVTASGPKLIACFIAGAREAAVSYAVKGAAFGAATKAIITAIQTGGDIEESLYGSLEGSADGYMWGAIYGAATGGFSSKYCFAEDTEILTQEGYKSISEINVGEAVYSYDELSRKFMFAPVTQVIEGQTNDVIAFSTKGGNTIRVTESHPFMTNDGWKTAAELNVGDSILNAGSDYSIVDNVESCHLDKTISTYNLCIEGSHTYTVGSQGLVAHNRCKPNEKYANETYYFPEGTPQAAKYPKGVPFDANGYPRFEQYAEKVAKFDFPSIKGKNEGTCLVGNCSSDFALANAQVGLPETPAGYTWHHCEDMQTMLLVPQDLHSTMFGGVAHAGGESNLRELWAALAAVAQ